MMSGSHSPQSLQNDVDRAHRSTGRMAITAMLFALAMALSYFESLLPPISPFPLKYGLSNIPVMFALNLMGPLMALALALLKALFALASRGALAALLSGSGGILSVLLMLAMDRATRRKISYLLLSITGAITHNMTQLLLVQSLFSAAASAAFVVLFPMLLLLGLAAGALTGITFCFVMRALPLTLRRRLGS